MIQRIFVLTRFFIRRFFFSFTGIIFINLSLVYWILLFPPGQGTPEIANYTLVIGVFGAAVSFLAALAIASQANEAANFPFVVRLPSRVEYLTAVLFGAIISAAVLQFIVAVLALYRGPISGLSHILSIPPIWIAVNILTAVLALHATDFVTAGWSRVYIFGILAVMLFSQDSNDLISSWLSGLANNLGLFFRQNNAISLAALFNDLARWLNSGGGGPISRLFGFIFWPFRAMVDAVIGGFFDSFQAFAPAALLLYATFLFLLAADFFANKDLDFIE